MGSTSFCDHQPSRLACLAGPGRNLFPRSLDMGSGVFGNIGVDAVPTRTPCMENRRDLGAGRHPERSMLGIADQTVGDACSALPISGNGGLC